MKIHFELDGTSHSESIHPGWTLAQLLFRLSGRDLKVVSVNGTCLPADLTLAYRADGSVISTQVEVEDSCSVTLVGNSQDVSLV